jgi:hypothetical protein
MADHRPRLLLDLYAHLSAGDERDCVISAGERTSIHLAAVAGHPSTLPLVGDRNRG